MPEIPDTFKLAVSIEVRVLPFDENYLWQMNTNGHRWRIVEPREYLTAHDALLAAYSFFGIRPSEAVKLMRQTKGAKNGT